MAALNFNINSENAIVWADSEVRDAFTGDIWRANKVVCIPHLNLIVACTGFGELLARWVGFLNYKHGAVDINSLDKYVTQALQEIWRSINDFIPASLNQAVTVYHFGFAKTESDHVMRAYAYRSTNEFKSEFIRGGLMVEPDLPENFAYSFPEDMLAMVQAQADNQLRPEVETKVHIGGEVVCTTLDRQGFTISTLGRINAVTGG
ncbi:hypothetical protein [Pseudomonas typographi]|uniref:Tail protein n=1 Tax=Pseudomonas typographi TaxID=2715964 RepID=A0ABR7ZA31_9PSED|nr:hypothetical protein [Pseudomonas typographi]MBD1590203.1 hypothetical protein [Pseudomonas typographi]MBD1602426.1 hypothetical protein [Pseudomonas typographi]